MVNALQTVQRRVVKGEGPRPGDPRVMSKAGLALVQTLARRLGLFAQIERMLPRRKDPKQGFAVSAALLALVHGLLSGGRGYQATEPMRGDTQLLKLLGLKKAPAAETIEEVLKYLADCEQSTPAQSMQRLTADNAQRLIQRTTLREMLLRGGDFLPVFGDGSLAEVTGKEFDAIKTIGKQRGQMIGGVFVGPYATGLRVAGAGEGELSVVRELIERAVGQVLRPGKLLAKSLFLLDSLYGNEPTLEQLEGYRGASHVVGAGSLSEAQRAMHELPECCWRASGAQRQRGWEASAVATAWLQCKDWTRKRVMVCRRWRLEGEMFWNYSAVITNLTPEDPRIARRMAAGGAGFEETIWGLYDRKQGLENQWKELLSDLGLHHPPCARAAVNSIFDGVAALAYNLAVGVRLLGLSGSDRHMRLWRLRRELFDVAGHAMLHGRQVIVRFVDACDERIDRLLRGLERLAQT